MSKEHQHDQWVVNGSPVFGIIPGGLLQVCPNDSPMHLFRGTTDWGWTHIANRHGQQRLFKFAGAVEELVWTKCSEYGDIHIDPNHPHKLSVTITVAPTAFMVVKYMPQFSCFSIVTMYSRRKPCPHPVIGKYVGPKRDAGRPVYAWLPYLEK